MSANKNLNHDKILNLSISVVEKGYRVQDVDGLLDQILEDYDSYEDELSTVKEELKICKQEYEQVKEKLDQIQKLHRSQALKDANDLKEGLSNSDVVKRIASIENTLTAIQQSINKNEEATMTNQAAIQHFLNTLAKD